MAGGSFSSWAAIPWIDGDRPCRIPNNGGSGAHIANYNGTCTNNSISANMHAVNDNSACTDPGACANCGSAGNDSGGRDMRAILNQTVVLDYRAGIDDDRNPYNAARIDDGPGKHHTSVSNAGGWADGCAGIDYRRHDRRIELRCEVESNAIITNGQSDRAGIQWEYATAFDLLQQVMLRTDHARTTRLDDHSELAPVGIHVTDDFVTAGSCGVGQHLAMAPGAKHNQ
jgi:hypothetical protein